MIPWRCRWERKPTNSQQRRWASGFRDSSFCAWRFRVEFLSQVAERGCRSEKALKLAIAEMMLDSEAVWRSPRSREWPGCWTKSWSISRELGEYPIVYPHYQEGRKGGRVRGHLGSQSYARGLGQRFRSCFERSRAVCQPLIPPFRICWRSGQCQCPGRCQFHLSHPSNMLVAGKTGSGSKPRPWSSTRRLGRMPRSSRGR